MNLFRLEIINYYKVMYYYYSPPAVALCHTHPPAILTLRLLWPACTNSLILFYRELPELLRRCRRRIGLRDLFLRRGLLFLRGGDRRRPPPPPPPPRQRLFIGRPPPPRNGDMRRICCCCCGRVFNMRIGAAVISCPSICPPSMFFIANSAWSGSP